VKQRNVVQNAEQKKQQVNFTGTEAGAMGYAVGVKIVLKAAS
jgi:hypothetical protein